MDRKNWDSYTTVYSSPSVTSAGTPLWQIIVSAVVGLLALLVLIIVLVKCDFFRNDAMQLSFFYLIQDQVEGVRTDRRRVWSVV